MGTGGFDKGLFYFFDVDCGYGWAVFRHGLAECLRWASFWDCANLTAWGPLWGVRRRSSHREHLLLYAGRMKLDPINYSQSGAILSGRSKACTIFTNGPSATNEVAFLITTPFDSRSIDV
jgi:hypothetical protein